MRRNNHGYPDNSRILPVHARLGERQAFVPNYPNPYNRTGAVGPYLHRILELKAYSVFPSEKWFERLSPFCSILAVLVTLYEHCVNTVRPWLKSSLVL